MRLFTNILTSGRHEVYSAPMEVYGDYRDMLKAAFLVKKQRNDSYSHNSFARDIGISSAYLSLIYSKKRKLNTNRAHAISKTLGWSGDQSKLFNTLVRLDHAVTPEEQKDIQVELDAQLDGDAELTTLSIEQFRIISRWYHSAIIELTRCRDFKPDPKWIGQRLGIDRIEAELAIERLVRLRILRFKDGKIERTNSGFSTKEQPSIAIRNFHGGMLKKAEIALESHKLAERDITGCVIATNPDRLREAKKMIAEFRQRLATFLSGGEATTIYHLGLQLFRLDQDQS